MAVTVAVTGLRPDELAVDDATVVDLDSLRPGQEPDAVVVRASAPHRLVELQRAHARHPDVATVVVVPADGAVRRAMRYTPGIPADLDAVTEGDPGLAEAVRDAATRTARRRRHQAVLAAVSAVPHEPAALIRPASRALGSVLDHAPLAAVIVGPEGELLGWNPRAEEIVGLTASDVGTPVADVFADPVTVLEAVTAAVRSGSGRSPAVLTARRPGISVEVRAAGTELDDGRRAVLLLLVDVTARLAVEAARDALQDRLTVVRRSQEFLLRASEVLARASDYADTLTQLAAVAVPTLGDMCVIDVVDGTRLRRMAAQHADPAKQPLVDELRRRYSPVASGAHPAAVAVRKHGTQWTADVTDDLLRRATVDEGHYALVKQLDYTGYIAVPLAVDDEVLGILTVVTCGPGRRFTPDDVALVEELAGRIALVVGKARRYDREHAVAVALQRSMLTALPDLPPLEMAARYTPAHGDVQVGGDWYDAFALPGECPALVIGDVVGHDQVAAGRMGQLRSALRALARGRSERPAEVLTALDDLNDALGITDFATVLYAVLEGDRARPTLRWSSAGHPPPLLVGPHGDVRFLEGGLGRVLGAPGGPPREEATAELPPGSLLVLYTDGLVERRDRPLMQGLAELGAAAEALAGAAPEDACEGLLRLAGHAEDDIALLVVRVPG